MHALKVEDKDNMIYKGDIWVMVEQEMWRCKMDKHGKDNNNEEEIKLKMSFQKNKNRIKILEANISDKYISSKN